MLHGMASYGGGARQTERLCCRDHHTIELVSFRKQRVGGTSGEFYALRGIAHIGNISFNTGRCPGGKAPLRIGDGCGGDGGSRHAHHGPNEGLLCLRVDHEARDGGLRRLCGGRGGNDQCEC